MESLIQRNFLQNITAKIAFALVEHKSILSVVIKPVNAAPHSYSSLRCVADMWKTGCLLVPPMPHKQW